MAKTSKINPHSKAQVVKKSTTKAKKSTPKNNGSIEEVEMRIITKMAERYHAFGIVQVPMADVLKFAGYAYSTAPRFHQTKKALLAKGDIEYEQASKSFSLTEQGLARAPQVEGAVSKFATNEAFHAHLKESFESPKAAAILDLLQDGRAHERPAICTAIGYKYQTAPAFAKSLKELREVGLLKTEGVAKGMMQLSDKAFLANKRPNGK